MGHCAIRLYFTRRHYSKAGDISNVALDKNLKQFMGVPEQEELLSSTPCSPELISSNLNGTSVGSPTPSSTTAAPPTLQPSGFSTIIAEGSFLEELVAHVRKDVEKSFNTIVSADADNTSKRFQMKGPIDKLRKVLENMESVYASIEGSEDSGSGESSDASTMPVGIAVKLANPVVRF